MSISAEHQRNGPCHSRDDRLHLVAQMTSGTGVERERPHPTCDPRQSAAIRSAASRGLAAEVIGRPMTR